MVFSSMFFTSIVVIFSSYFSFEYCYVLSVHHRYITDDRFAGFGVWIQMGCFDVVDSYRSVHNQADAPEKKVKPGTTHWCLLCSDATGSDSAGGAYPHFLSQAWAAIGIEMKLGIDGTSWEYFIAIAIKANMVVTQFFLCNLSISVNEMKSVVKDTWTYHHEDLIFLTVLMKGCIVYSYFFT